LSEVRQPGTLRQAQGRPCCSPETSRFFTARAIRNEFAWDGAEAGEWHPSTLAWKEFIQREVDGEMRSASVGSNR
jgi:hypothetical protein